MVFLHFLSKKLVCLWSIVHTYAYALPFKSWNMRRNIMTTFFLVSSYPINDWKLWLICFNETSIMNCSLINHNNPVLRALPFHSGYSGSYFTQLLEVSGFRTRTVKKAYYHYGTSLWQCPNITTMTSHALNRRLMAHLAYSVLQTLTLFSLSLTLSLLWVIKWSILLQHHQSPHLPFLCLSTCLPLFLSIFMCKRHFSPDTTPSGMFLSQLSVK